MPAFLQEQWDNLWQSALMQAWIGQIFLVIFGTLIVSLLAGRVLNRLYARLLHTRTRWDNITIDALRRPVQWWIWTLGLAYAMDISWQVSEVAILSAVEPMRKVAVIVIGGWFGWRFVRGVEDEILRVKVEDPHNRLDATTAGAITKLLRVTIIITTALVALQTLGISIGGLLAFGGVGGIAVGFAAKDLLANFFGGLIIYLDRPFAVGDWIRSPDKDIEGTVEHIGWRVTRIRTFDKRPLYVPNSIFTTIAVENPSRMSHRRIYETIGVRYQDMEHVAAIVHDVRQMLQDHEEIDSNQTLIVNLNAFGPSSVDFFVYCFTHTTNWVKYHGIKEDVLLKIAGIIASHEAEIAYPTTTVHFGDPVTLESNEMGAMVPVSGEGQMTH